MTTEEPKYKTVKYQKHAELTKRNNGEWLFESDTLEVGFALDMELVDILDDLSIDGYILICEDGNGGFILRSKEEFEETIEYYED